MDIGVLLIAAIAFFFILAACLVIVILALKTKENTDQVLVELQRLHKEIDQLTTRPD